MKIGVQININVNADGPPLGSKDCNHLIYKTPIDKSTFSSSQISALVLELTVSGQFGMSTEKKGVSRSGESCFPVNTKELLASLPQNARGDLSALTEEEDRRVILTCLTFCVLSAVPSERETYEEHTFDAEDR